MEADFLNRVRLSMGGKYGGFEVANFERLDPFQSADLFPPPLPTPQPANKKFKTTKIEFEIATSLLKLIDFIISKY